ncbi:MAG: hypothetical protein GX816_02540 [Erysipelotrichia bacterium]|jgi:hypothetical protein|nr:hypothetical protein [Erysipelotrichia bacterium]
MKETIDYNQIKNIEFIKNDLGNGLWVQVCGFLDNDNDAFVFAVLVSKEKTDKFLKDVGGHLNFSDPVGFVQYGNKHIEYQYKDFGGIQYFVRERYFHGIRKDFYELSDEFLLLFNAYKDTNKYFAIEEDGDVIEIAKYLDNGSLVVNNVYLRRFAAAKQMNIGYIFDFRVSSSLEMDSSIKPNYNFEDTNINYEFYSGSNALGNGFFTRLNGRKIIECGKRETCGLWPFINKKKYANFKVGFNSDGTGIECNCNPDYLDNYFNANPGNYHYLTPVAFKKEVLKKYLDHPDKYNFENNRLSCGSLWGIEIDAAHEDVVLVYLGDLGRDLPESEYQHWLSYNIVTNEGLSKSTIERDFFGMFSESTNPDDVFKQKFNLVNDKWNKKYGWKLFLDLKEEDNYCYTKAIMPLINEQHEFDELCLVLSKITVDSINIKSLEARDPSILKGTKSLAALKTYLLNEGIEETIVDEIVISFRNVQSLRSEQAGHRKGSELNKLYKKVGILELVDRQDFIQSSRLIFESLSKSLSLILKYCFND